MNVAPERSFASRRSACEKVAPGDGLDEVRAVLLALVGDLPRGFLARHARARRGVDEAVEIREERPREKPAAARKEVEHLLFHEHLALDRALEAERREALAARRLVRHGQVRGTCGAPQALRPAVLRVGRDRMDEKDVVGRPGPLREVEERVERRLGPFLGRGDAREERGERPGAVRALHAPGDPARGLVRGRRPR